MKRHWEIVTENLRKAGWRCGCIVSIDSKGRDIFVVVAYGDGKRFIVRSDKELTAFVELESAIQNSARVT